MTARHHTLKPQPTAAERLAAKRKLREQPPKGLPKDYYLAQKYATLSYDYGQIAEQHRELVQRAALDIRARLKRTVEDMIEIGRQLNEIQELLHYQQFYEWAQAEFGLSRGSVFEFSRIAIRFGGEKRSIIEHIFSPTVLRRLAAVSVPDEAVEAVIAAAGATAKPLRVQDAMAIIKPFLPVKPPKPKQLPPPPPLQGRPEPVHEVIEVEYTVVPKHEFIFPAPPLTPDKAQPIISRALARKLQDALLHRIMRSLLTADESDELLVALTRALEE